MMVCAVGVEAELAIALERTQIILLVIEPTVLTMLILEEFEYQEMQIIEMTELVFQHQGMIIHLHEMGIPGRANVAILQTIDLHNRQHVEMMHHADAINLHNLQQEKEHLHHHIRLLLLHVLMKDRDLVVQAIQVIVHVQAVVLIVEGDVNQCIFKKNGGGIKNEKFI